MGAVAQPRGSEHMTGPVLSRIELGNGENHYLNAEEFTALAKELADTACVVTVRYSAGEDRNAIDIHVSYHAGLDFKPPREG